MAISSCPLMVVVGAGHLGKYHIQKLKASQNAELVGVVEINPERQTAIAAEFGIAVESSLQAFGRVADAAIIATPSTSHSRMAIEAMQLGMDVLVEKPLAASLDEAHAIAKCAAELERIVQVGHTERFNPAIAAALEIVDRPRYIVAERLGPFTGRSTDTDVILDLMIHDLDIVAHLVPSPVAEVRAVGVPVLTSEVDMASVRIEFEDGTVAQFTAGRASLEPNRKLRFFTKERYVSVDCVQREVKSVRRLPPEAGFDWPQIRGEPVVVPKGDPLTLQDEHFIHCVATREAPRVGLDAGLRALDLAHRVIKAMRIPHPTSY